MHGRMYILGKLINWPPLDLLVNIILQITLITLYLNDMLIFQAQRIKEEAIRLIDQHKDLMEDVSQQQKDAEDMLDNGIRQQQVRGGNEAGGGEPATKGCRGYAGEWHQEATGERGE